MEVDPNRKVTINQNETPIQKTNSFFTHFFIGLLKLLAVPFRWFSVQFKLVMDDKQKLDRFKKWSSTHQKREKRRLRLNNEF